MSAGTSAAAAKPASSQSVVPIVPSNANVSASAPASAATLRDERGGEGDAEGSRAAERAHEDSSGQEEHAGRGGRQPEREPEPVLREQATEDKGSGSRGNERQEARGRAEPATRLR